MKNLISKIAETPGCSIRRPKGQPSIAQGHVLPIDIEAFYSLCGGVEFFADSDYSIEVVAPEFVTLANPAILPEGWEQDIGADDISNSWYVIGRSGEEQWISIDLAPERLGRCYDSFWDRHAVPGSCQVVAYSFTDLLQEILKGAGGYWFWLQDGFEFLGDAYDEV